MKREPWMSDAGHVSGEQAEVKDEAELAARRKALLDRSPAERFAAETLQPIFFLVLIVGSVLGAVFASEYVRRLALSYLPDIPDSFAPAVLLSALSHIGGFFVGMLAAFLVIDVPLTGVAMWLRKHRPQFFQPRG